MPASPLRYKRLIQELPKHKTMQKAVEAAGFTKQVARTQAKSVIRSAVRNQAKELLNMNKDDLRNSKQLMNEILGISSSELFNRLKFLALEQDKDYGVQYKLLSALAKQHGVILSTDEDSKQVNVPILNIVVDKTDSDNMAKNIEPVSDHVIQDSQELDNGLVEP